MTDTIQGLEDPEFRRRAEEAADLLLTAALPRPLASKTADVSCRMAAALGLIVELSRDRMFGPKAPADLDVMAEFLRSYGGAMGFVTDAFGREREDAATLVIHFMLDFLARKDPRVRSRIVAKLAIINLEEHAARTRQ